MSAGPKSGSSGSIRLPTGTRADERLATQAITRTRGGATIAFASSGATIAKATKPNSATTVCR